MFICSTERWLKVTPKKPRIDEIKDLLNRYSYEYYTLDKPRRFMTA